MKDGHGAPTTLDTERIDYMEYGEDGTAKPKQGGWSGIRSVKTGRAYKLAPRSGLDGQASPNFSKASSTVAARASAEAPAGSVSISGCSAGSAPIRPNEWASSSHK
eukprot:139106-Pleurochrysis_carterae.AAC.1